MKMRSQYTCPLEMTHDIIKGKWKPLIIWQAAALYLRLKSRSGESARKCWCSI